MGVSNVSYGMPMRGLINRAFLAMSIAQGLDLAMIDPCDESMSEFLLCGNLLTGKDINGKKFIRHFNGDN
jgi:5-methyltetrahydrofolate--homocysteine methyltransferase